MHGDGRSETAAAAAAAGRLAGWILNMHHCAIDTRAESLEIDRNAPERGSRRLLEPLATI